MLVLLKVWLVIGGWFIMVMRMVCVYWVVRCCLSWLSGFGMVGCVLGVVCWIGYCLSFEVELLVWLVLYCLMIFLVVGLVCNGCGMCLGWMRGFVCVLRMGCLLFVVRVGCWLIVCCWFVLLVIVVMRLLLSWRFVVMVMVVWCCFMMSVVMLVLVLVWCSGWFMVMVRSRFGCVRLWLCVLCRFVWLIVRMLLFGSICMMVVGFGFSIFGRWRF